TIIGVGRQAGKRRKHDQHAKNNSAHLYSIPRLSHDAGNEMPSTTRVEHRSTSCIPVRMRIGLPTRTPTSVFCFPLAVRSRVYLWPVPQRVTGGDWKAED